MNHYPFDADRSSSEEAASLVAWIKWQLTITEEIDVHELLAIDTGIWATTKQQTTKAHDKQVFTLLRWWIADLVDHVSARRENQATHVAFSIISAIRESIGCSNEMDHTELMEDQITLMDPSIPDVPDDWEEVA